MRKTFILLLSYVISLSALSLMTVTRNKIGPDAFLPWQLKVTNSFARVFLRLWMVLLLYVWIRVFFVVALKSTDHASPFDASLNVWTLLTMHGFPLAYGDHTFFFYLSYAATFFGLLHIISLEFHYKARSPISAGSLGKCFISGSLEGKKIFGNTIDQYLIWGIIEPALIISLGFLLNLFTHSRVLLTFFVAGGAAMFLQGQMARLKHRDLLQQLINAKQNANTIQQINDAFIAKAEGSIKSDKDENQAGFV